MNRKAERHVVLVHPEVHWNTGNIGRTCLGADASLHLVKPLGFSLDSKQVKRAGLDYWPKVRLFVWKGFADFLHEMNPGQKEMVLFSKNADKDFWQMKPSGRMFLVFGSETMGLPRDILHMYPQNQYHIPITRNIRSLNLSTSAGIALYESLRTSPVDHAWPDDENITNNL